MSTIDDERFGSYLSEYLDLLAPLFEIPDPASERCLFEFVCCLVHPGGIESTEENPFIESTELLDDLALLARAYSFATDHPARTQMRLALISYCHLTEVSHFYDLLVNLLRLRCGEQWALRPFQDLGDLNKKTQRRSPAKVGKKVIRIAQYAARAGHASVGEVIKNIHLSAIRNAVFHADYAISETDLHLAQGYWASPEGFLTRDIPHENLLEIIDRTFAFFYALLNRHELARGRLRFLEGRWLPFDFKLKGLIEYLFDGEQVCGFHVYWPNRQHAEFRRTNHGCRAVNIFPNLQGGLNIDVGIYATRPSRFSPLVESGEQPTYTSRAAATGAPRWPIATDFSE